MPALLLGLTASVPADGQDIEHPASGLPIPRSRLTSEEAERAIRIATDGSVTRLSSATVASPSYQSSSPDDRTVVSGVEMVAGNKDEPVSVFAIVTTYNYDRHETSRRLVDLTREAVVWERIANDGSGPLAPVEIDEAKRLALEDGRIRGFLGASPENVDIEFLRPTIRDPEDPLFGKRIAQLFFKTENDYVAGLPSVIANLTDGEIVLED